MKNKLLLSSLALIGVQMMNERVYAQTSVNIQQFSDSLQSSYCPPPVNAWIYMYGQATGYVTNSPMNVQIDFGDGFTYSNTVLLSGGWFSDYPTHTYNFSGIYLLRCIVEGPDANADTAYYSIVIGDTCGNISGKTYNDMNADCLFNAGDVIISYAPVELIYNSQNIGWTSSDVNGDYFFSAPTGNTYEVKIGNQISNYGYAITCPISGQYSVPSLPSSGNDFGLTCLNGFDLQAHLWSQRYRPGFISYIYPAVSNAFCMPVSGQAKLVIDDFRLTYVASQNPPNQISGDTLIWNFSNLSNTNYWNWWYNSFGYVQVLTDVNAVIGDSICVTLIVEPISGDVNPANNTIVFCNETSNSLDPNVKGVSPVGEGPGGNVPPNTEFTYNIQFQNTGTDTAYNIFILDTLEADLNMNTFTPIASSHAMQTDILPGNIARFTFSNIMLVDSFMNESLSHGWVSYKISAKLGLSNGTQISNTAGIYFDFNPPVITNTTINTINILLGMNENGHVQSNVVVYPNPANTNVLVTLNEKQTGADVMLVNALGQTVLKEKAKQKEVNLDVRNLLPGIYNLIVNDERQNTSAKLVLIK